MKKSNKQQNTNVTTRKLTQEEMDYYNKQTSKILPTQEVQKLNSLNKQCIDRQSFQLQELAQNDRISYVTKNHDKLMDETLRAELLKYQESVLSESEKEMLILLDLENINEWAESVTFEQLAKFTFNRAKEIINEITLKRRIKLLGDLDYHLIHLYEATKGYNDKGFGKSMSPDEFYGIMGKIKHYEVLQNWLFGIE
jgi:hypothetical protein